MNCSQQSHQQKLCCELACTLSLRWQPWRFWSESMPGVLLVYIWYEHKLSQQAKLWRTSLTYISHSWNPCSKHHTNLLQKAKEQSGHNTRRQHVHQHRSCHRVDFKHSKVSKSPVSHHSLQYPSQLAYNSTCSADLSCSCQQNPAFCAAIKDVIR